MRNVATKNFPLAICSCAAIASGLFVFPAGATVIVVPAQQPTIQAAINAASNGDTILVSDGVYSGAGNRHIDLNGKAVTLRSMNGPENCTIDVQGTSQNQNTAFYLHMSETSATVIEGFTIRGGYAFNGAAMMLFSGSSPTIRNCIFTENQANCWGGAIYFDGTNAKFIDCQFIDNYSTDDGGAVFGFSGSPSFTNCVFAGNDGSYNGGALFIWGSSADAPKLSNCTIAGNHANYGPAISSNVLRVENSIIWGNSGMTGPIYTSSGPPLVVRYSNVHGGYTGPGNINLAPAFVDALGGDFHLLPGSPCIDTGDAKTIVAPFALDCDGDPRKFGTRIDMGVDEYRKSGDVNGDHAVNVNDLLALIGAWGPCTNHPADLNGDFFVDVNDLLILIGAWG